MSAWSTAAGKPQLSYAERLRKATKPVSSPASQSKESFDSQQELKGPNSGDQSISPNSESPTSTAQTSSATADSSSKDVSGDARDSDRTQQSQDGATQQKPGPPAVNVWEARKKQIAERDAERAKERQRIQAQVKAEGKEQRSAQGSSRSRQTRGSGASGNGEHSKSGGGSKLNGEGQSRSGSDRRGTSAAGGRSNRERHGHSQASGSGSRSENPKGSSSRNAPLSSETKSVQAKLPAATSHPFQAKTALALTAASTSSEKNPPAQTGGRHPSSDKDKGNPSEGGASSSQASSSQQMISSLAAMTEPAAPTAWKTEPVPNQPQSKSSVATSSNEAVEARPTTAPTASSSSEQVEVPMVRAKSSFEHSMTNGIEPFQPKVAEPVQSKLASHEAEFIPPLQQAEDDNAWLARIHLLNGGQNMPSFDHLVNGGPGFGISGALRGSGSIGGGWSTLSDEEATRAFEKAERAVASAWGAGKFVSSILDGKASEVKRAEAEPVASNDAHPSTSASASRSDTPGSNLSQAAPIPSSASSEAVTPGASLAPNPVSDQPGKGEKRHKKKGSAGVAGANDEPGVIFSDKSSGVSIDPAPSSSKASGEEQESSGGSSGRVYEQSQQRKTSNRRGSGTGTRGRRPSSSVGKTEAVKVRPPSPPSLSDLSSWPSPLDAGARKEGEKGKGRQTDVGGGDSDAHQVASSGRSAQENQSDIFKTLDGLQVQVVNRDGAGGSAKKGKQWIPILPNITHSSPLPTRERRQTYDSKGGKGNAERFRDESSKNSQGGPSAGQRRTIQREKESEENEKSKELGKGRGRRAGRDSEPGERSASRSRSVSRRTGAEAPAADAKEDLALKAEPTQGRIDADRGKMPTSTQSSAPPEPTDALEEEQESKGAAAAAAKDGLADRLAKPLDRDDVEAGYLQSTSGAQLPTIEPEPAKGPAPPCATGSPRSRPSHLPATPPPPVNLDQLVASNKDATLSVSATTLPGVLSHGGGGPPASAFVGSPTSPYPYVNPQRLNPDGSFAPTRTFDSIAPVNMVAGMPKFAGPIVPGPLAGGGLPMGAGEGWRGGAPRRGRGSGRGGPSRGGRGGGRGGAPDSYSFGGPNARERRPTIGQQPADLSFVQFHQAHFPHRGPGEQMPSASLAQSGMLSPGEGAPGQSAAITSDDPSHSGIAPAPVYYPAPPARTFPPATQPPQAQPQQQGNWMIPFLAFSPQPAAYGYYSAYGTQPTSFDSSSAAQVPAGPAHQLLSQIEFYFSQRNLQGDFFLRQRMDSQGWVDIAVVASFKRVQSMTRDLNVVRDTLLYSSVLDVDVENMRVRKRYGWDAYVLPEGWKAPELAGISHERDESYGIQGLVSNPNESPQRVAQEQSNIDASSSMGFTEDGSSNADTAVSQMTAATSISASQRGTYPITNGSSIAAAAASGSQSKGSTAMSSPPSSFTRESQGEVEANEGYRANPKVSDDYPVGEEGGLRLDDEDEPPLGIVAADGLGGALRKPFLPK
ncbi:hypothetical protein IE53DRAFT_371523 [Violaceomyces palustris]|uniref:Uncharacterized protein n=1 Tax=Violaceomyces palustris TaxID=1673888 RepID=A0ACD0NNH0_9BASI|nr:hypothetical protein IE53DRAFT_371523 [Violaceomyces palustris]